MLTYPTVAQPSRRTFSLALPLVLIIAACGAAAGPSPTLPGATPQPTPTAVPGVGGVGGGGGSGGNTGGGALIPFPMPPRANDDPLLGEPTRVVPVPGRLDPHPVNVQLVRAAVDSGTVWAELRWWGGIEGCYPVDSVQVDRDVVARTIKLTVIEGTNPGEMACIDIAVLKATVVDLGALAAGTWTISAEGDAPDITLEVE